MQEININNQLQAALNACHSIHSLVDIYDGVHVVCARKKTIVIWTQIRFQLSEKLKIFVHDLSRLKTPLAALCKKKKKKAEPILTQ